MTLIGVYYVRAMATSATVCMEIAESHLLIAKLEYDVDLFNTLVDSLVKKLAANGDQTEDLFAHIVRAYKKSPMPSFTPTSRKALIATMMELASFLQRSS